jgi:hypothetical protein
MKIKLSHIIIVILVVLLFISNLWNKPEVETKTEYITDTVIVTKIDTFTQYKPKVVQTIIRETISVPMPNNDTLNLYYENKHYAEKEKYDAFVSGYSVSLDSISVYNKIEYKTITNTITNTIYKEKWNLYLETGLNIINNQYNPNIGLRFTMPNNFGIGGTIGLYDNKPIYGISLNYKIK